MEEEETDRVAFTSIFRKLSKLLANNIAAENLLLIAYATLSSISIKLMYIFKIIFCLCCSALSKSTFSFKKVLHEFSKKLNIKSIESYKHESPGLIPGLS